MFTRPKKLFTSYKMDNKLRKLERLAATGDKEALNRLLQEHLRLGLLKPIDPAWADYKKKQAQEAAKKMGLRLRKMGVKRLTPEQRKNARNLQKRKWKRVKRVRSKKK